MPIGIVSSDDFAKELDNSRSSNDGTKNIPARSSTIIIDREIGRGSKKVANVAVACATEMLASYRKATKANKPLL
jgi:hypothetical protein